MIDLRSEHLLRLQDLPAYLESRGFGQRVSMRTVKRWITRGCNGARLESIVIDRMQLTSLEALQRWVERQTAPDTPTARTEPSAFPDRAPPTATPEHRASLHMLTEHRVLQTELDRKIRTLDHPESTLAYAAGVLFRAGLRTPDDVRRLGLQGVLRIRRLGARSRAVVNSLWEVLAAGPATTIAPR